MCAARRARNSCKPTASAYAWPIDMSDTRALEGCEFEKIATHVSSASGLPRPKDTPDSMPASRDAEAKLWVRATAIMPGVAGVCVAAAPATDEFDAIDPKSHNMGHSCRH